MVCRLLFRFLNLYKTNHSSFDSDLISFKIICASSPGIAPILLISTIAIFFLIHITSDCILLHHIANFSKSSDFIPCVVLHNTDKAGNAFFSITNLLPLSLNDDLLFSHMLWPAFYIQNIIVFRNDRALLAKNKSDKAIKKKFVGDFYWEFMLLLFTIFRVLTFIGLMNWDIGVM